MCIGLEAWKYAHDEEIMCDDMADSGVAPLDIGGWLRDRTENRRPEARHAEPYTVASDVRMIQAWIGFFGHPGGQQAVGWLTTTTHRANS